MDKKNLNEQQNAALVMATKGETFNLTGAAGTGKSTTQKQTIQALVESGTVKWTSISHKYLPPNLYGFIVTSFTNVAVENLIKILPTDYHGNCLTIHKVLEFSPVYDTILSESGEIVTRRIFKPRRNKLNPLPEDFTHFIFDEFSQVSVSLFQLFLDAIHPKVKPVFIFVGDINQLTPVGDRSYFLEALTKFPVVNLTHVYRQALQSKILALAHIVLAGKPLTIQEVQERLEESPEGSLTIKVWKKQISSIHAAKQTRKFFDNLLIQGDYIPGEDMILCPYKVEFGVYEINKGIGNFLAKRNNRLVYQVLAARTTKYFSVGDRVLCGRIFGTIVSIQHNGAYTGKIYKEESTRMDYWGEMDSVEDARESMKELESEEEEFELEEENDSVHQASHIITVKPDNDELYPDNLIMKASGDVAKIDLAYALTVHKAQGSEWKRGFLMLHHSHNKLLSRELLYTALTRFKDSLFILCEKNHFQKGIQTQRIKGDTVQDKIKHYLGA